MCIRDSNLHVCNYMAQGEEALEIEKEVNNKKGKRKLEHLLEASYSYILNALVWKIE